MHMYLPSFHSVINHALVKDLATFQPSAHPSLVPRDVLLGGICRSVVGHLHGVSSLLGAIELITYVLYHRPIGLVNSRNSSYDRLASTLYALFQTFLALHHTGI